MLAIAVTATIAIAIAAATEAGQQVENRCRIITRDLREIGKTSRKGEPRGGEKEHHLRIQVRKHLT